MYIKGITVNKQIKKALNSNIFLKAMALVLSFSLWTILSESSLTSIWLTVPLCFYNKNDNLTIKAPETLQVELKGKRSHLKLLNKATVALHIDAQSLVPGPNALSVNHNDLMLPSTIVVADTFPLNCVITVEQRVSA